MFNICCPEKEIKINYKNRHPWIITELEKNITKREELLAKKYKYPSIENTENYNKYKNKVLSEIRKAEREYYRQEFEMTKNDLRKSWKVIKNIIDKDQINNQIQTPQFLFNNRKVSDAVEVANIFNDYFTNVGSNLAEHIISDRNPLSYVSHNHPYIVIYLSQYTTIM